MNLKPRMNNVSIQMDKEVELVGSIVIPEKHRDRASIGTVVDIGIGKYTDIGVLIKPRVKPGDRVYLPVGVGTEVSFDGKKLLVIQEDQILAKVV